MPGQGTVLQSYWFFVIDHKGFLIACMCVCSNKLYTNIFCGLELPSKIHIHACSCILALWNSKLGIQKWRTVTSPNAPRPIIVSSSKSSTPVLCRCNRMYSVSFRSRSFNILFCSSSVTSASANLRSSDHRLQQNHGYTHIKLHSSPLISTMKAAVKWANWKNRELSLFLSTVLHVWTEWLWNVKTILNKSVKETAYKRKNHSLFLYRPIPWPQDRSSSHLSVWPFLA